ncbi:MAG: regulator [Alphaproteobacteria bacterium]|nr:regulator [Alphaproteobacteria bacterium]
MTLAAGLLLASLGLLQVHAQAVPGIDSFQVGENVYVRALTIDSHRQSLWVGTSVGALEVDLASHEVKNSFTRDDGLANEYVFAIGVGPDQSVWFGTNAGGTSRWRDGEWTTYFPMHGLADYWVYAFDFDEREKIWIGTWDGASFFDPETERFVNFRDELVNIWVYGIDIDEAGRVWFGTEGGVSMYDGATWRSWTHEDGLGIENEEALPASSNTGLGTHARHDLSVLIGGSETYNADYVFAVEVDRLGRGVWFGSWGGGASLFDGEASWTSYGQADGLAGDVVYSIAQEEDGTLWFGTNHGLSRFDGESWLTFDQSDGLPEEHVYAIALDPGGDVWIGVKGGVLRLPKALVEKEVGDAQG